MMEEGKGSVVKQIIVIAVLGAMGLAFLGLSQRMDEHFKQNQAKAETTVKPASSDQQKR